MRKTLDHRTSKTYDIKPVDKRGELDEKKLQKGEELVELRQLRKEERKERILKRFNKEKESVSKERLIFDIGIKNTQEDLAKKEESKEQELQSDVEEYRTAETRDTDSPEEIFEKVTDTFKEDELEEETRVQEEKMFEKYSVLQGNKALVPEDATEIQVSKLDIHKLQMINEEEFRKDEDFVQYQSALEQAKQEEERVAILQREKQEQIEKQEALKQEMALQKKWQEEKEEREALEQEAILQRERQEQAEKQEAFERELALQRKLQEQEEIEQMEASVKESMLKREKEAENFRAEKLEGQLILERKQQEEEEKEEALALERENKLAQAKKEKEELELILQRKLQQEKERIQEFEREIALQEEREAEKEKKAAIEAELVLQRKRKQQEDDAKVEKYRQEAELKRQEERETAEVLESVIRQQKEKEEAKELRLKAERRVQEEAEALEKEKSRIFGQEIVQDDEDLARKRALALELQANTDLIEKNRLEAETRKEIKRAKERRVELAREERAEENRVFWESKLERKNTRQTNTLDGERINSENFEQAIDKNSVTNESIIQHKLNNWFGEEKRINSCSETKDSDVTMASDTKSREAELLRTVTNFKKEKSIEEKKKFFTSKYKKKGERFTWKGLVSKPAVSFVATSFVALLIVSSIVFVSYGFQIQENVKVKGQQALGYLDDAKDQLKGQDFLSAKISFASAVEEFEEAQEELDCLGGDMLNIFSALPVLSRISSGKNVVDAGNELTKAAKELSSAIEIISNVENPFSFEEGEAGDKSQQSMSDMFLLMQEKLQVAHSDLEKANENLALVKVADLPDEYREKFQKIKETLPMVVSMIDAFEENSEIFLEILGHNGPRKYLLIFQNNQEMRATGGFIGSYGVLHIANGRIKKLLIEGIYNPDGQLKQNIVPPKPIQKISASWSTHDANWFPHFPTTAEKISMFYEYTGGPTVDGIITMTPMVLQRMLAVTGPIEMENYDTTVSTENFVKATQYEVEVDYDKTENKPKQFLADLAPKVITNLLESRDPRDVSDILEMFSDMLKERHIMIHSSSEDIQKVISKRGWSGEILQTKKDYLMVVNSNINGFKTDGVVDEDITHSAKISEDGTIINTVKIKRAHNGGDTDYEWWNKVNCDYMRVYVPKGSEFISVKGQTREVNESPLDYDKLGFKRDEDVVAQEESVEFDEETGTRIYEEEEKTVFANWVYVSPKETVEIEYVYKLPFKLDLTKNTSAADTYSLLVQKQSGSVGSDFSSKVEYEIKAEPVWMYPQSLSRNGNVLDVSVKLNTDLFFGIVFQGEKEEE